MEAPRIGEIAAGAGIVLHELTPRLASLEEAFMEMTAGSLEYGVGPEAKAARAQAARAQAAQASPGPADRSQS